MSSQIKNTLFLQDILFPSLIIVFSSKLQKYCLLQSIQEGIK